MVAGGSAYFNTQILDGNSSTTLMIQPQFGLAFADNFVAGAWFNVSSFGNVNSWGVSPFVRYYFSNFFFQAGYGYTRTGELGTSTVAADFGYAMFFNDNVALEPALYFNYHVRKDMPDPIDIGFKLGFQIYFNR